MARSVSELWPASLIPCSPHPASCNSSHAFLRSCLFRRSRYLGHPRLAARRRLRRALRVRRPRPAVRGSIGDLEEGARLRGGVGPLVDAREELCRDFAFPVLGWQAKYEGIYLLGTSIARPLIAKCLLAGGPRRGGRCLRPRGDRQGQRPVPLPAGRRGAGAGDQNHRPLANQEVPRQVSRPQGDDRLLRGQEDSREGVDRQAVQLRRELPAHQLRGRQAGRPGGRRRVDHRLRHDRLAAGRAGQGRGSDGRLRARRAGDAQRQAAVGAGNGAGA